MSIFSYILVSLVYFQKLDEMVENKGHGEVQSVSVSPKGYQQLLITVDSPYCRSYQKFNLWKNELKNIQDGDHISFKYVGERTSKKLVSLEKILLSTCNKCLAHYIKDCSNQEVCNKCSDIPPKVHLKEPMILLSKKFGKGPFSDVAKLCFVKQTDGDNKNPRLYYNTNIYERHPFYRNVDQLDIKFLYNIDAWIEKMFNEADFYINLREFPTISYV